MDKPHPHAIATFGFANLNSEWSPSSTKSRVEPVR